MNIAPQGRNGPRIAVIGGGISGMGAAYALADTQNVTLYEVAPRTTTKLGAANSIPTLDQVNSN